MYTLGIISQKGGAGKTTLAINLAVAAENKGKQTVLVDIDPQASAKKWADVRSRKFPIVISSQAERLEEVLKTAKENKANLVIIDTSPHSEKYALKTARNSDLVLIPCRPGLLDIFSVGASVDICSLAKVRSIFVLNAVNPRGSLIEETILALNKYNISTLKTTVGHRVAFVHSLTNGQSVLEYETRGKAAQEIIKLYAELCLH